MGQPSKLRDQLREAFGRVDEELKSQGESAAKLKEQLRAVVEAVERKDEAEAKKLMKQALDYEYNWILNCEIGAPLSEFIGYDGEEE